ncbi:MAG: hypothetical protein IJ688_02855 [Treponema sp.]|nr:hypothetical protein [Treponema sp.]
MNLKKTLLFTILTCCISFFSMEATGAGFQAGFYPAIRISEEGVSKGPLLVNATGTIRCSRIPLVFGAGIITGSENSRAVLGLSVFADWWAIDNQIKNNWNFFSGFGLSAAIKTDFQNNFYFSAGPRFFAGMNWIFIDNFIEAYFQQNILPSISLNTKSENKDFMLYLPFEAGVRLHF